MQNNSSLKTQAPIVAVRIDGKFYIPEIVGGGFVRVKLPKGARFSDRAYNPETLKHSDGAHLFPLHAPDRLGRHMTAGGDVVTLTHNCSDGDWDGVIGVYKRCFKPSGEHRGGIVECNIIGPAEWFEPGGKYHIAADGDMIAAENHGIETDPEIDRGIADLAMIHEALNDPPDTPTTGTIGELIAAHDWESGPLRLTRKCWFKRDPTLVMQFEAERDCARWTSPSGAEVEMTAERLLATDWTIVTPKPDKLTPVEAIEAVKDLLGKGKTLGVLEDDLHNIIDRTDMEGE